MRSVMRAGKRRPQLPAGCRGSSVRVPLCTSGSCRVKAVLLPSQGDGTKYKESSPASMDKVGSVGPPAPGVSASQPSWGTWHTALGLCTELSRARC